MQINEITSQLESRKKTQRVGRGDGSGRGKTSGRGTKGNKARTGGNIPARFEGGQTPFSRRMPKKKGFKSNKQYKTVTLNLYQLPSLLQDGKLTLDSLIQKGLLTKGKTYLKVLGSGEISEKIEIEANQISQSAKQKIEAAGGKVTIVK